MIILFHKWINKIMHINLRNVAFSSVFSDPCLIWEWWPYSRWMKRRDKLARRCSCPERAKGRSACQRSAHAGKHKILVFIANSINAPFGHINSIMLWIFGQMLHICGRIYNVIRERTIFDSVGVWIEDSPSAKLRSLPHPAVTARPNANRVDTDRI